MDWFRGATRRRSTGSTQWAPSEALENSALAKPNEVEGQVSGSFTQLPAAFTEDASIRGEIID
jgi:hypothetical protein